MRPASVVCLALVLLVPAPLWAETDTPVTMQRIEGEVSVEEHAVEGGPHPTALTFFTPVEVRTRAVSGFPLTAQEREEVRALALDCGGGGAESVTEAEEADATLVIRFTCRMTE